VTKGTAVVVALAVVATITALACTQITIFVVQPIGAVPEGRTLIISRMNKTKFVDSADGMCQRLQGGVNLFCRLGAMGGIATNATIYARLPYSETLYLISTDGKKYDK
jgi:hypothetical protein